MSETFTLERLFEAFPGGIRVPRIQRGYVQGRDDEKGKEIHEDDCMSVISEDMYRQ